MEKFLSQLFVSDNAAKEGSRAANSDGLVKSRVVKGTDMLDATRCWELYLDRKYKPEMTQKVRRYSRVEGRPY